MVNSASANIGLRAGVRFDGVDIDGKAAVDAIHFDVVTVMSLSLCLPCQCWYGIDDTGEQPAKGSQTRRQSGRESRRSAALETGVLDYADVLMR